MTKKKPTGLARKKPRIAPEALAAFGKPSSHKPASSPCGAAPSDSTQAYLEAYYGCACQWGRC